MGAIPILLIVWPALAAAVLPCIQDRRVRGGAVYGAAVGVMVLASALLAAWMAGGAGRVELYVETELIDHAMLLGELVLMGLIILLSIRHRKYPIILLSAGQTLLVAWSELTDPVSPAAHMRVDGLAMLLCIIAAFVGGFICIYAVGYMKAYHQHHEDYIDRSGFFFSMLFLFLAAMFGLVLSENLVWMYFFWEITSVVSFLLIGYTRTEEAVNNSFRALWMNLLGGFGFAVAIAYAAAVNDTVQLTQVVASGAAIPVVLLAFAALTKSAQMPFSSWLLGAMVAPTPSSALLHSATMVKAGVYLLIRLAPALAGTLSGVMVSFIGGFTFIVCSMMAIAQNDGKKVLAFSTISNLGLIVACAGIGVEETIWAAVLLTIFHSVAKSLLFQAVGSIENSLGSRDIESMHGLLLRLPQADLPDGHRHRGDVPGPLRNADLQVGGAEILCGRRQLSAGAVFGIRQRHHHAVLDQVAEQAGLPAPHQGDRPGQDLREPVPLDVHSRRGHAAALPAVPAGLLPHR